MSQLISTGTEISESLKGEYLGENPCKNEIWVNGPILEVWLNKMTLMKDPKTEIRVLLTKIQEKSLTVHIAEQV